MALVNGSYVEVVLRMLVNAQTVLNVWSYVASDVTNDPPAAEIGEEWWEDVSSFYRGLAASTLSEVFQSVLVRQLNDSAGIYGEYAIPSASQAGTRTPPADNDQMPQFVAAGVRLTVGTRETRPGQKRFPFLTQSDVGSFGALGGTFTTLLTNLMTVMEAPFVLASGSWTATLTPYVFRRNNEGFVTAAQPVLSYSINPFVTTQNTRKTGRGE